MRFDLIAEIVDMVVVGIDFVIVEGTAAVEERGFALVVEIGCYRAAAVVFVAAFEVVEVEVAYMVVVVLSAALESELSLVIK